MMVRLLRRPQVLLVLTFAGLILVGAVLLRLPVAHAGQPVGTLDALFTATSATCITGLITVDTATAYSRFGQTVVLSLFQLGGLGVMTFGALAAELLRLRVSFSSQAALQDMFFQEQVWGGLRRAVRRIVALAIVVEGAGTALLHVGLPAGSGLFTPLFLSVSAFCNAGFSVYSDSVVTVCGSALVACTLMVLITLGGLGYPVLFELVERSWRRLRGRHPHPVVWSLHSRVVLRVSAALTLGGAAVVLLTGGTATGASFGERCLHSLFQSVTARTAGFNSIPIGALPLAALLVLMALMFVGGSPGSCAGGIKTTTAAIWTARVWARLRGYNDVTLLGRRLPHDLVSRATLVLSLATVWNVLGVLVLAVTEGQRPGVELEDIVFEQVSAFATVGLSTGLTPDLSNLGKLWIIATMFVGRLGPLTVALAVILPPRELFHYPSERIMVG